MTDILFSTQQSLFAALAADATLQSLIGNPARLYDHAPPALTFPYVTFGAVQIAPYDDVTGSGFEQIVTLDIWSRYRGSKEAKDILAATYDILHRAKLTVAGADFILCEFHGASIGLLDDGLTTHAAARYQIAVGV